MAQLVALGMPADALKAAVAALVQAKAAKGTPAILPNGLGKAAGFAELRPPGAEALTAAQV
eukprot:4281883-Prymnesium_polylepis.1